MILTADYNGHAISLDDSTFGFHVSGPSCDQKHLSSYLAATTAIDEAIKAAKKQKRTEAAISIPMLDDAGQSVTLKGIHVGTGKLLGCGDARVVYPPVEWVRETLLARVALQQRLARMTRALDGVGVPTSRGYGRIASEKYDGMIADLSADIATKTARAVEMTPKSKTEEAA